MKYENIDFSKGVKFLDKELNEIISDSDNIKRDADKLLEIYLKDGSVDWILIHIEVQSYHDGNFTKRMYTYNYRIFDKHQRTVISLAVFIYGDKNFRPDTYSFSQFGFELFFKFPYVKLVDFKEEDLLNNDNSFAIVTRIQQQKIETEKDMDKRFDFRLELMDEIYQNRYSKVRVVKLYKFIDYILKLPKPKEIEFKKKLEEIEEKYKMPYITSNERIAKEEEAQEAVLEVLEVRFGNIPYPTKEKVMYCDDLNKLKRAHRQALLIKSLDEFNI